MVLKNKKGKSLNLGLNAQKFNGNLFNVMCIVKHYYVIKGYKKLAYF